MKKTLLEIVSKETKLSLKIAEAYIREGRVIINGEKVFLPTLKFDEHTSKIELIRKNEYVSRAANKLLAAINNFDSTVSNKVCLDIGSSTGGFVQVLLEHGAKKVYAVDSGTNQLNYQLRINPQVVVYEKTNLKHLTLEMFNEPLEFVSCDVSFISLKHVFKVCEQLLSSKTQIMALIKPQFEASSKYVLEGGFVEEKHHEYIINKVINYAKEHNFTLIKIQKSPILGEKAKNIEYLSLFEKD
ncbi:predicted 23S rRNA methylase [Metamycoplasma arthritidis]|uniref:Predicted 23S rRNA methylase n=1 Tax=Metamycoplasma arthritidis (strain 158L3-1) TaxID=243272 RepID=B3PM54_META1|nr:TlyA family RNA methyltransferase [Metamycoplasma arthritidis]ACF07106.1 predicted 23S rRNA methylase [Metamycoplasma arthritidis 158L3-1]VEU78634.1 predicted 23S rRNA methylase [Metamycoplasma arthritidis]